MTTRPLARAGTRPSFPGFAGRPEAWFFPLLLCRGAEDGARYNTKGAPVW